MRPDVLYDIDLNDRQIRLVLGCPQSTWYRWLKVGFPHAQTLILRSLASGLPVSAAHSHLWEGHSFNPRGQLITPTGYPLYPRDLWVFEFMQRNGMNRDAWRITSGTQGANGDAAANDVQVWA